LIVPPPINKLVAPSHSYKYCVTGFSRLHLGLPNDWDIIEAWLINPNITDTDNVVTDNSWTKKCPEIPTLHSYQFPPDMSFWRQFPCRTMPQFPTSPVDADVLQAMVDATTDRLTLSQKFRASQVIKDLKAGFHTPTLYNLPQIRVKNSSSAFIHGDRFTDNLAWWVKQGYVAGPFAVPPYSDFRSNSMMAVEQKNKIRIIMNLSEPEGQSFNDAIDEDDLEHVHMSTARQFGYSVVECGKNAKMWKYDFTDAYKNIPTCIDDRRLQGFMWLGKYFVESQQVFGSKAAVSAFDRLGHTLVSLAIAATEYPPQLIHRTLDDVLIVAPAHSEEGEKFALKYKEICGAAGANLAQLCPNNEKSFESQTKGTALGIIFDSASMTWTICDSKKEKLLSTISAPLSGQRMTLLDMQQLVGGLNDFGQMCPFLRAFRFPLIQALQYLTANPHESVPLTGQVLADLQVWAAAVRFSEITLPIPHRQEAPSACAITFVSDAAGARFAKVQGRFIPFSDQQGSGAASVSAIEDGPVWFCATLTWPTYLLLEARDARDHAYGCKSPTLEAIAAMLPFLCCPHKLIGEEVILLTDNEAVVYGWDARRIKHDESASIILKSIHIIASYLGCTVSVQHLPRMSTDSAILADKLSRTTTTTSLEESLTAEASSLPVPQALTAWLEAPSEDWNLPLALLTHVKETLAAMRIHIP